MAGELGVDQNPIQFLREASKLCRHVTAEARGLIDLIEKNDPDRQFKIYQIKQTVVQKPRKDEDRAAGYTEG